jgi:hypothetical protein
MAKQSSTSAHQRLSSNASSTTWQTGDSTQASVTLRWYQDATRSAPQLPPSGRLRRPVNRRKSNVRGLKKRSQAPS